jgi:predicted nuclease with TOPRIM domain
MENSVAFFKMQSMNQSLIALLVNGITDIDAAMKLTTDPEDLSLKLRKIFPKIEERFRGGVMAPSANDFSAITELMDIKKLYEEQEEKWRARVAEKEELIQALEADVQERERAVQTRSQQNMEAEAEIQHVRQDSERMRQEMAAKVAQLNERIKELNARLMGGASPSGAASPAATPPAGFFKR